MTRHGYVLFIAILGMCMGFTLEATADKLGADYLANALAASVHGNPASDGRLNLWSGTVPVRFYENCDPTILAGGARQVALSKQLSFFIAQLNELQSRIRLSFSVVPCGGNPPPNGELKFGIAIVPGGKLAGIEQIIQQLQNREGALSLLTSIQNGATTQFDTGCFSSGFRDASDSQYKAALVYLDLKIIQFSPTKCEELGMLSSLGFIGDMKAFPESLKSFSSKTQGLSDLDKCLVTALYSEKTWPGMPIRQLNASAKDFVTELCANLVAK